MSAAPVDTPRARALPRRFRSWLNRRIPPARSVTLDQKRIFIFPTRDGLTFLLLVACLLVAAINYQNSLMFAVTFLLGSLFHVAILHTYRNLAGLTVEAGNALPAFAGEDAEFEVVLRRAAKRRHQALGVSWVESVSQTADLVEESEVRLPLFLRVTRRGRFRPDRLLIETRYPLNLLRSWTWIDLDMETIVYPRPMRGGTLPAVEQAGEEGQVIARAGTEDYAGMRQYAPGDPVRHIAWKTLARSDNVLFKEYQAYVDARVWLDFDALAGDVETRLSRLTGWCLELSGGDTEYGLRLPGQEILPARGETHARRVLTALALYGDGASGAGAR